MKINPEKLEKIVKEATLDALRNPMPEGAVCTVPRGSGSSISEKNSELWKLADKELKRIGGYSAISRNKNKEIRDRAKVPGTWEWAILETQRIRTQDISDDAAQMLIDIIKKGESA